MMRKPHILFIFTDDQRFDTIHALGNPEIHTPNMDWLVERGTAFTHAHIPSGTCAAVCMPSRAMLHTGRTLFHIENEGQNIPSEHITMGEAFRQAGYRTFGTGKWHNGANSYARSFTDGGSIFFGGMWDHWNVPICDFDPEGRYDRTIPFTGNFSLNNKITRVHCDRIHPGNHSTDLIAGEAVNFLERYQEKDPYLMYVSFLAPHDPRTMPEEFLKMYDPENITLPGNFAPEHPFDYGVREIRDELLASYPRTEEGVRRHIAEYYAMITHLDHAIGTILQKVKDRGELDQTIVVLAGDNGLAVGQHGLFGKQSLYEHSVRVPLLFSGPGIPRGLQLSNYAYLLDIYPTLCGLAGIPIPDSVEGLDLHFMMKDPSLELRKTLYFAYGGCIRGVKDRKYKLIEYAGKYHGIQLFDLEQDPLETCSLVEHSEFAPVIKALREELCRYRDAWDELAHPIGRNFIGIQPDY
ncbi:MAG TPA: choline-sulfatase [Clostridiales bacterium]|nr:choline-sulfatase [Clostridiales bacterium]